MISQEHITTTLKNQIKNGTAAHAYLFTGSRGTGKTTCAKIFAAAVNCLNPKDGNPCLECESCKEILNGTATDIVEMDAASNRGVDDVRQLRDEVSYSPVSCKYRVYIIDEVHMLTPEAFNALLKTLEEPPAHVKFILATTEQHVVPATIVSRCQRFEFRRVDAAKSAQRLLEVAEKESVKLDEDAALLISRLSDGGMRDALSILDRCATLGERVTCDVVRECAGVASSMYLFDFSRMIASGDTGGCIRLLSELHRASKDMAVIVDELSGHFRDLMICKTAPSEPDLLSCMPADYENVRKAAEAFTLGEILRCLTILRECADGIGKTRQRKTFAEMSFVRMCTRTGVAVSGGERPVLKQEEYRVEQPKKEAFVPTPPEQMSRESLMNISKMREIAKGFSAAGNAKRNFEAAEVNDESMAAEVEAAPENVTEAVTESSAESAIAAEEPFAEPVENTEPPIESGNFENRAAANDSREEAENNTAEVVKENPTKSTAVPARITRITEEEWQNAVGSCRKFTQTLLAGSKAELDNGTLVVRTDRVMLLNNANDEMLKGLQDELSKVLGYPVILKIEKDSDDESSEENLSEVDKLLNKAKSLGIDIKFG